MAPTKRASSEGPETRVARGPPKGASASLFISVGSGAAFFAGVLFVGWLLYFVVFGQHAQAAPLPYHRAPPARYGAHSGEDEATLYLVVALFCVYVIFRMMTVLAVALELASCVSYIGLVFWLCNHMHAYDMPLLANNFPLALPAFKLGLIASALIW